MEKYFILSFYYYNVSKQKVGRVKAAQFSFSEFLCSDCSQPGVGLGAAEPWREALSEAPVHSPGARGLFLTSYPERHCSMKNLFISSQS